MRRASARQLLRWNHNDRHSSQLLRMTVRSNRRLLRDACESALDRASYSAPKPGRWALLSTSFQDQLSFLHLFG